MSCREGKVEIHIERADREVSVSVACSAEWGHPSDMQVSTDDTGVDAEGTEWGLTADERQRAAEMFAAHVHEALARAIESIGNAALESWKARREEGQL